MLLVSAAALLLALAHPGTARAQSWLPAPELQLSGGLEVGGAVSGLGGDGAATANLVSLPVTITADVAPHWEIGLTAGLPFPVPVSAVYAGGSLGWRARARSTVGFGAQLGLRGVISPVSACVPGADGCRLEERSNDPTGPIYFGKGVLGELGISYRIAVSRRGRLLVAAHYVAGHLWATKRDEGFIREGIYNGPTVLVGVAL